MSKLNLRRLSKEEVREVLASVYGGMPEEEFLELAGELNISSIERVAQTQLESCLKQVVGWLWEELTTKRQAAVKEMESEPCDVPALNKEHKSHWGGVVSGIDEGFKILQALKEEANLA